MSQLYIRFSFPNIIWTPFIIWPACHFVFR